MLGALSKTSTIILVLTGVSIAGYGVEDQKDKQAATSNRVRPVLTLLAGDMSNVLTAHSLAFGHDGKQLVVNGQHGTLYVWDVATGESLLSIRTLAGFTASAPAFSRDGKYVAAGVRGAVAIWDNQGVLVRRLKGQTKGFFSVVFSPDSKYLAGAGSGLSVWEVATGREVVALASKDTLFSVAYSPDGMRLAAGGKEGVLRVWTAAGGKELHAIRQGGTLQSVCFSPTGARIASAGYQNGTIVWDAETGKRLLEVPGAGCTAYSSDGKYFATARSTKDEEGNRLTLWEGATGKEILIIRGNRQLEGLAFSPDGRQMASVSSTAVVEVWDVGAILSQKEPRPLVVIAEEGQPVPTRRMVAAPQEAPVIVNRKPLLSFGGQETLDRLHQTNVIRFTRDGSRLIGSGLDGQLHAWDAASGKQLLTMAGEPTVDEARRATWDVAVSPDGKRLASAHEDKTVRIWDADTGRPIRVIRDYSDIPLTLTYNPAGNQLAVGDKDGGVRLWNAETGKEECCIVGHAERVNAVSYSPDGKRLATAGLDGTARVWDVASGKQIFMYPFGGWVQGSLFSPDGRHVVSTVRDALGANFVSVWSPVTGKESFRLPESGCARFSPDGKRLATAGENQLRIWDAATGRLLLTIQADTGVTGMAFHPDGNRVATVTGEYAVKIWDVTVFSEVRE
jgi:WD40 repeat protein